MTNAEPIVGTIVREGHQDRHDADGKPYMAYFRTDLTTGFMWSGFFRDPVQVTAEMGEDVTDEFPLTTLPPASSPFETMYLFQQACDAWAEVNRHG